ncbi:MAG: DUF3795 domain-containing protein [Promethearchaeota archaeon]
MSEKFKITTCGLSCDLCDSNTSKLQESSINILLALKDPMFSRVISVMNPNTKFTDENLTIFREMLEEIGNFPACPGCDNRFDCSINQCAKEKEIMTCANCFNFNGDDGVCTAPATPSESVFTLPAPAFFKFLSQRYQNTNVRNLQLIAKGDVKEVENWIEKMIKEGKTSRDLIDTSVNPFEMRK